MSTRISLSTPELNVAPEAWEQLQGVLGGSRRPALDARSLKALKLITAVPNDVRLRPACFEMWPLRGGRYQYLSVLAAPVLYHLMRRLGLSKVLDPSVGLLERVGLGATFGKPTARAVWIVPRADEVAIFLRDAPKERGPRVAITVPTSGPWALPANCAHPEPTWTAATRACPYCKGNPDFFRLLDKALICPDCGRSFEASTRAARSAPARDAY